jgi:hypothetical protein
MKNVTRVISLKVLHIDNIYVGKKYDKIFFLAAPIMDELKNQVEDIVYHDIIKNLSVNFKNNFKHG